jgi:phage gpG-like protein
MKEGFNFDEIKKQISAEIKKLPKEMAIEVKDESVSNLNNKSFYGKQWPSPKEPQDHPLLNKTGNLKNAVKQSVSTGKKGSNFYSLVVINDYGLFHNEGTSTLPKREFIGESSEQIKKLTKIITNALDKLWML